MAGDLVIDGRNALDPGAVRAAGLEYEGIGGGDRDPGGDPRRSAKARACGR